jgi:hypothetical protein
MPKRPNWISPAVALFGFQPKSIPENVIDWSDGDSFDTIEDVYIADRVRLYKLTRLELEKAIKDERERRATKAELNSSVPQLRRGHLALVFAPDRIINDARGMKSKWLGPYSIVTMARQVHNRTNLDCGFQR